MDLSALLAYELLGNPGERWLMAVGAFVVALFVLVSRGARARSGTTVSRS